VPPAATEQTSGVSSIVPGTPCRSLTESAFPCCEYTDSVFAVQVFGIQVSTGAVSVALEVAPLNE